MKGQKMQFFDEYQEKFQSGKIAVVGVPLDQNSSFLKGAAQAPPLIRKALFSYSANLFTENGIDLTLSPGWLDVGDLTLTGGPVAFAEIEQAAVELLSAQMRLITLGGDHSITYPLIRAYAKSYTNLTILQLDAHPDLYDELDGNRHSHACPFARIMEENLVSRLVQVGIRTMTSHQRQQADRFGVEVVEMKNLDDLLDLKFTGDVYLSLDMDCLDPAFAPGISHHEPGGLSTRQVIRLIQGLEGNLVGADIVEYNPTRDQNGVTAMVAAKLLKEIIGRICFPY
jgi:agmatinase